MIQRGEKVGGSEGWRGRAKPVRRGELKRPSVGSLLQKPYLKVQH